LSRTPCTCAVWSTCRVNVSESLGGATYHQACSYSPVTCVHKTYFPRSFGLLKCSWGFMALIPFGSVYCSRGVIVLNFRSLSCKSSRQSWCIYYCRALVVLSMLIVKRMKRLNGIKSKRGCSVQSFYMSHNWKWAWTIHQLFVWD